MTLYWEEVSPKFELFLPGPTRVFTGLWSPMGNATTGRWHGPADDEALDTWVRDGLFAEDREAVSLDPDSRDNRLVLYSEVEPQRYRVLIAKGSWLKNMPYNVVPPYWWDPYGRIWDRLRAHTPKVKEAMRAFGEARARGEKVRMPPTQKKAGYCGVCCLPLDKHVSHEPFGGAYPNDMGEYYRKCRESYFQALGPLTLRELFEMPLPTHRARIQALHDFLRTRQKGGFPPVKAEPLGRLDLLLGDALDL